MKVNFSFFNLKHQIDWYIKHTKYFLRVPCRIYNGLLCYHIKTTKRKLLLSQLLPNLCQFSGSAIISENSEDYFPRVSLLGVFKASDVVNRCALLNLLTYCRCHSGFGPPKWKWKSLWRRASVPRVTFWNGFKQCKSNPFAVILFSKCLLKNTLRPGQPPPSPPPFPTGKPFSRIGLRLLKELKFHQFLNFLKRRLLFFMLQCFSSVSKQSTCWCRLPFLRNWHGSAVCLSIDLAP